MYLVDVPYFLRIVCFCVSDFLSSFLFLPSIWRNKIEGGRKLFVLGWIELLIQVSLFLMEELYVWYGTISMFPYCVVCVYT